MSDTTTPTTDVTPTPDAGAVNQAATPAIEPAPFAVFPDAKSFNTKVGREARKLMNEQAKAAGFDDWAHMSETLGALRQAPTTADKPETVAPAATPATPAQPDEAARLRMAIQTGTKLNLPTALVLRLQGTTVEEMEADAQSLVGLMTAPRGPGIPNVPQTNQPVTFTRAQLQDAKFVREHKDEILRAGREGRIVDS